MSKNRLTDAFNNISDEYIREAHEEIKKKKSILSLFSCMNIGRLVIAAAVICLAVIIIPNFSRKSYESERIEAPMAGGGMYDSQGAYEIGEDFGSNAYHNTDKTELNVNRKLIVNGSMRADTLEFDRVMADLNAYVNDYGAYFQSSSVSQRYDGSRFFEAVIRIPSESYSEFIEGLKGSANVSYYSEEIDDITDVYSDLSARVTSLKAEESRVMEFYKDATGISELMEIEERLADIRYEIDSLETRIRNYDLQVDYSTLTLSINETRTYAQNNDSFLSRLSNEFLSGWISFTDGIEELLFLFVYYIFEIIAVAALGVIAYRWWKKRRG